VPPREIKINIPEYVLDICKTIKKHGFKCYVVGGALRDQIIHPEVEPQEWDIATSALPDDIMKIFPKCIPTGIAHGTVTVIQKGRKVEVTTFRIESGYSDARHPDSVTFVAQIEKDLGRRDFTINAMAYDPLDGIFVDPYGGMDDLSLRLIKAVGDPLSRFREDGLRPLRAARFATVLGFRIENNTFDAMKKAIGSFLMVSSERKRDEIIKMMDAEKPSHGWEILRKAGYIDAIFPEMKRMIGAKGGDRHKYDVWNHSIMACDFCRGKWQVKFACLFHDIGKPFVEVSENDSGSQKFYGHEKTGADIVGRWMERMRFSNEDIKLIKRLIAEHMVIYSPEWTDSAIRRFIRRVGRDIIDDLFKIVEADIKATGDVGTSISLLNELKSRVYNELKERPPLTIKDLAIGGLEIMKEFGLEQGPEIGMILRELLEKVIEDPSLNRRETLLKIAREIKEKNR